MHKINRNFAVGLQITINTMLFPDIYMVGAFSQYKKILRKNAYTKTSRSVQLQL